MSEDGVFAPLSTGWRTWRDFVVRHAGFPASLVDGLAAPRLWDAAARHLAGDADRAELDEEFAAAEQALSAEVRRLGADGDFREAVTWQNPRLVPTCLDKAAAGEPRNVRGRNHEAAIVSYAQRYALKNDTIGFFGPVAWGRWDTTEEGTLASWTGSGSTSRTTYHETWAVDALADALSADQAVRVHDVPRPAPAAVRTGRRVRRPGSVVYLDDVERHLVDAVDGRRTVSEIADVLAWGLHPELGEVDACLCVLDRLEDLGVVVRGWDGPVEARPERRLRARLEAVPDEAVRTALLTRLDGYLERAAALDAAHGDQRALAEALAALAREFTEVTGAEGSRRAGRNYAGRTLAYLDARSDVRVTLGRDARDALAGPLGLALDTASWLVDRTAEEYRVLFDELHAAASSGTGEAVPLPTLMNLATPHLYFSLRRLPAPVERAREELRARWQQVHGAVDGGPDVDLDEAEARGRVAEVFGRSDPHHPPWPTAYVHTPDVMVAAAPDDLRPGRAALGAGGSRFVLGELHVAVNTLESRVFVEQSPHPERMLEAAERGTTGTRVYAVPAKGWLGVTSRLSPPSALLSPQYRYWALHDPCVEPPGPCPPAEAFSVVREDGGLVVLDDRGGRLGPLLHVVGEFLSASVANAFSVTPSWARSPRVTVGGLVLSRRTWTYPAADLAWARTKDERTRYLEARRWWEQEGLPRRAFYTVPIDDKPVFCDWSGIAHLNAVAKAVRQTAEEQGSVTIGEMLPGTDELWLLQEDGDTRACELRMVAVPDPGPAS